MARFGPFQNRLDVPTRRAIAVTAAVCGAARFVRAKGSIMMHREAATCLEDAGNGTHHVPATVGHHVLFEKIAELRSTPEYLVGGHAARTLFKRPEMSVVLVVLARGSVLNEHRVDGPVSIQTLQGSVTVHAPARSVEHVAAGLQLLDPSVVHEVEALSDSAILVSIPWPDLAEA